MSLFHFFILRYIKQQFYCTVVLISFAQNVWISAIKLYRLYGRLAIFSSFKGNRCVPIQIMALWNSRVLFTSRIDYECRMESCNHYVLKTEKQDIMQRQDVISSSLKYSRIYLDQIPTGRPPIAFPVKPPESCTAICDQVMPTPRRLGSLYPSSPLLPSPTIHFGEYMEVCSHAPIF